MKRGAQEEESKDWAVREVRGLEQDRLSKAKGANSSICLAPLPQSIALYPVMGQALEDQGKRGVHREADKTPTLAARRGEQHIPVNSACKSFNMLHTQHE